MKPEQKDEFKLHLAELYSHLQKEFKLKTNPKITLVSDQKNADKILGKTAYYNPQEKSIALFITDRHPKDILRSFSHEVIHHWQHEHNKLEQNGDTEGESDPQYAQNNPWLRQMEKQAYLLGNMMFRDWEDKKKNEDKKSNKKMAAEGRTISNVKHLAWDQGAINKAMGEFGMFNFQNTAKTLCGKKVGYNKIDNHNPTCPECIAERKQLNTRPEGL